MNLDNKTQYKKLDKNRVAESIERLPDQMRQVLDDAGFIKIPKSYSQTTHIAVNGMGGSNLGMRIIRSLFSGQVNVPITIIPGYQVPAYVNANTLYLISSYSGNTEEPISTYRLAKKQGAKILAITENNPKSKLYKLMIKDNIPGYIFKPEQNPSQQPRLGLGYSIFGQAILLAKAGHFEIKVKTMDDVIAQLEIWTRKLRPISPTQQNFAKKIALQLNGYIPIIIGAEFLVGNLHAMRNQINESAKQFAAYLEIPDLNHYTMEGLRFPKSNKNNLKIIIFESPLYHPRVQERIKLTKQVLKKNKIKYIDFKLKGKNKITQSFELLQLGSWISYYLGILNNVNPSKIPYVDWFKKQLK